jgi:mannose/fructose/N-acetylgalactosamine-specific phosphotransferase system component IIC
MIEHIEAHTDPVIVGVLVGVVVGWVTRGLKKKKQEAVAK